MSGSWILAAALVMAQPPAAAPADEPDVFSGPQVGEELVDFQVRGVFGDRAGEEFALLEETASENPVLVIFMHELTRPSAAAARATLHYAAQREEDGLRAALVFLGDDLTAVEDRIRRAQRALTSEVPIVMSVDGQEGPGSLGLNRQVTLTVLLTDEDHVVTANYALVQPSVQADVPRIVRSIVDQMGGEMPDLEELMRGMGMRRPAAAETDPQLGRLLRSMIQMDATEEEVDEAAERIEAYIQENRAARRQLAQILARITDADVIERYGTPHAREYLMEWSRELGERRRGGGDRDRDDDGESDDGDGDGR